MIALWVPDLTASTLAPLGDAGARAIVCDVVWRDHDRNPQAWARLVDGCAAAIADGFRVTLRLGPRLGVGRVGLGVPERVLADETTWARASAGAPIWLPAVPRLLPLLDPRSASFLAAARAYLAEASAALGPVRGDAVEVVLDDDGGEAWRNHDRVDPSTTVELLAREVGLSIAARSRPVRIHAEPPPFWPRLASPAHDVVAKRAVIDALLADAPAIELDAALPWAPALVAKLQRLAWSTLRRSAPLGLVDPAVEDAHVVASSPVPALSARAASFLALGPAGLGELALEPGARMAVRLHAAAHAAAAQIGAEVQRVAMDADREQLLRHRVVIVPSVRRVPLALWRHLTSLAAARALTVVVGPEWPTLDELDQPLPDELRTPRRVGRMRPGSVADPAGLAADLATLIPDDARRPAVLGRWLDASGVERAFVRQGTGDRTLYLDGNVALSAPR